MVNNAGRRLRFAGSLDNFEPFETDRKQNDFLVKLGKYLDGGQKTSLKNGLAVQLTKEQVDFIEKGLLTLPDFRDLNLNDVVELTGNMNDFEHNSNTPKVRSNIEIEDKLYDAFELLEGPKAGYTVYINQNDDTDIRVQEPGKKETFSLELEYDYDNGIQSAVKGLEEYNYDIEELDYDTDYSDNSDLTVNSDMSSVSTSSTVSNWSDVGAGNYQKEIGGKLFNYYDNNISVYNGTEWEAINEDQYQFHDDTGNYYLDKSTSTFYKYMGNSWEPLSDVEGDEGLQSPQTEIQQAVNDWPINGSGFREKVIDGDTFNYNQSTGALYKLNENRSGWQKIETADNENFSFFSGKENEMKNLNIRTGHVSKSTDNGANFLYEDGGTYFNWNSKSNQTSVFSQSSNSWYLRHDGHP